MLTEVVVWCVPQSNIKEMDPFLPDWCWFFALRSNVTPQSRLDLKLWSCHTLRKELLGSATIDLLDTLRTHHGKSKAPRTHSHSLTFNPLSSTLRTPSLLVFSPDHGYSMFLLSLCICYGIKQEMALVNSWGLFFQ